MHCRRYVVSGRVQGVFYRASARETAVQIGLVGWVRNCGDGSVELMACGEDPSLKQLEQWLWQGPKLAQVSSVDVTELEDLVGKELSDFSIRY